MCAFGRLDKTLGLFAANSSERPSEAARDSGRLTESVGWPVDPSVVIGSSVSESGSGQPPSVSWDSDNTAPLIWEKRLQRNAIAGPRRPSADRHLCVSLSHKKQPKQRGRWVDLSSPPI